MKRGKMSRRLKRFEGKFVESIYFTENSIQFNVFFWMPMKKMYNTRKKHLNTRTMA